ncbi:hypothetical protein Ae201684P_019701 [Aphanomyces euteiches]|uniref:Uncharacterized protein n=1 Tax=Aphanomyces euteiches TaxID=100861 RepID=A0A6G0XDX8_9STRA|nr:hypothetical protein Ae201684_005745 [Aphanomyces euteiches]KAH9078622.1 hypothetical protein Ae201684P_019701 [Aphanomyces euteiches]KAH9154143.1 hypothetical protein AeRB84_003721 [Aphanomyces euteiches]
MVKVCIVESPTVLHQWWLDNMTGGYQIYLALLLFFFALVVAMPLARLIFFILRYVATERWKWKPEAQTMIMWETYWLLRIGLFCAALKAINLTDILCQWPLWIFGAPLLLWLNKAGDVIREIAVRRGSAKTLLFEIVTVVKMFVLCVTFYLIYILIFPGVAEDILRGFYTGVCILLSLAIVPVVRNVSGSQLLLFNQQYDSYDELQRVHLVLDNAPAGVVQEVPMGYVLTTCDSFSKIYIPGGRTMESPLALFEENVGNQLIWPLRLRVALAPNLSSANVRRFMMTVDVKLNDPKHAWHVNHPTHRKMQRKQSLLHNQSVVKATAASANLRSDSNGWFISVQGRWILHIHGYIYASSQAMYRQVLSENVQQVMALIEAQGWNEVAAVMAD